jgi:hypothetical protein
MLTLLTFLFKSVRFLAVNETIASDVAAIVCIIFLCGCEVIDV